MEITSRAPAPCNRGEKEKMNAVVLLTHVGEINEMLKSKGADFVVEFTNHAGRPAFKLITSTTKVSPVVPFDELGDGVLDLIVEKLIKGYRESSKDDWIKRHVMPSLLPRVVGGSLARGGYLCKPFLDMAIVLYVPAEEMGGRGLMWLTKEIVANSHLTEDEVFEAAEINAQNALCIDTVGNVLSLISKDNDMGAKNSPLLVVSNGSKYGAGVIASGKARKDIVGRLQDEAYIVPSSRHEVLVIPMRATSSETLESVKKTVLYVNSHNLSVEDFLSDSVYKLTSEGNIEIAA